MSKILIWETLSEIGGGQQVTLRVADILQENNELHFVIPQQGELSAQLEKRGVSYTLMGDQSMPKGRKGFLGLLKFLYLTLVAVIKGRRVVNKINPDIIYAPGPAALVWSAMCAKRSTKVVWHLHHVFESGVTLKLINIFSARKCVKRIISVSEYVSQQITNEKAQNKKVAIYNSVEELSPEVERKNLCDEFPLLDKELRIAQIGFITKTKKQHKTLSIVNELVKRGESVCLAIIGSVRQADVEYKNQLDKTIEENNLMHNVVFTGYRTDVQQIMSTFDVVVLPSVEGFPLVAIQALSECVPVLTVDNSGCAEIVKNTGCGMIYSKDSDIGVIADTLLKCAMIDVKSAIEKHPDFLKSGCSKSSFVKSINNVFSL